MMNFDPRSSLPSLRTLALCLLGATSIIGCGSASTEEESEEPDVEPWSRAFGSDDSSSEITGVALGASGNVALTGTFGGTLNFGAGDLVANSSASTFVAKLSAAGEHIWSGRTGGGDDFCKTIALDRGGSAIVAGEFNGSADFGTGTLTGFSDLFLARFGASGSPLWSKQFGDTSAFDAMGDIAVDVAGNIHLTGRAGGQTDFGLGTITDGQFTTLYVAKLNASGGPVWSRGFDVNDFSAGRKIAADAEGNTIVAGQYAGALDVGGGTISSPGSSGVFLAKFGPGGAHLWSTTYSTDFGIEAADVTTDADGNVLVVGVFGGTVDFGGQTLATEGNREIFLVKLGADGALRVAKRFGNSETYTLRAAGVGVDGEGNIYLGGSFDNKIDLGGGVLQSSGADDVFLAKLSPDGAHIESRRFGDSGSQTLLGVAVDRWGNTVLTGTFYSGIDFGTGALEAPSSQKIFVARLP